MKLSPCIFAFIIHTFCLHLALHHANFARFILVFFILEFLDLHGKIPENLLRFLNLLVLEADHSIAFLCLLLLLTNLRLQALYLMIKS